MIQRIYIDTSVIGGCFDNEFASGDKKLIISDIILLELEEALPEVRDVLNKIPKDNNDYVFLNQESTALANT